VNLHKRDIGVIALIWIAVFAGVAVLVTVGADDDPRTGTDWAGAGQLAGLVGGALTFAYVEARRRRPAERDDSGRAPVPTAVSRRIATKHVKQLTIVLALWLLGTIVFLAVLGAGWQAVLFGTIPAAGYVWLRDRRT
jgi:membrane associated rhomboid family serine protease